MRLTRQQFLQSSLGGFGALALQGICAGDATRVKETAATSVIYLYMEGGPSQVDTFEPKPRLEKEHGKPLPFDKPATVFNSSNKIMASPFKFSRYGESGGWASELFPHLSGCMDDLTFIHSMHHGVSNHSAGCYMSHTGDPMAGRPSIGSWVTYGLGTENDNVPGFVVLDCGQSPSGGAASWSSGFLPSSFSGAKFHDGAVPVEFLSPADSPQVQNAKLRAIRSFARLSSPHSGLESQIESYEKAARMQNSVPDLLDISRETKSIHRLYGLDDPRCRKFGSRCLIARKLVESGVRFVELFSPRVKADRWDQHSKLKEGHINNAVAVDQPIAGLLQDLKQRGLLEKTLVLWGGEFGRTPSSQGSNGRDHNPFGYTVFMAGGGMRAGYRHGSTDEFGYYAEQDKVHLHDLHATILYQLGINHEQLTYRYAGRDYRLTDVYGRVVTDIIQS